MKVFRPLLLSLVTGAAFLNQSAIAGGERVSNAEICASAKGRYFGSESMEIDCQPNFHHYNSGGSGRYYKKKKKHDIRIAGFNVFHLGDNQTRFKDFAVMADVMNQWDVVAAVEVQPLPMTETGLNESLAQYIADFDESQEEVTEDGRVITLERLYGDFIQPGYIRLLKELRALDPSWALVLAPEGEGSGTHTELTGIYYRSRNVKAIATQACGGTIGCPSKYPSNVALAVERNPFLASFQAGNFDFIFMGVHLRFREPKQDGAMDLLKKIFNGPDFGVKRNEEIARWAELKTVLQYAGRAAADEEKDFIVAGDFNLERGGREQAAWDHVLLGLPGAAAYLNSPTSISKKNGLASEYDHFVLNPEFTRECDADTASSFNFMDSEAYPRITDELARQDQRMEEFVEQAAATYKVSSGKYVPMYSAAELKKLRSDYKRRMISSQSAEATKYLVYMELVSDHIPASMKCSGSAKDDD